MRLQLLQYINISSLLNCEWTIELRTRNLKLFKYIVGIHKDGNHLFNINQRNASKVLE